MSSLTAVIRADTTGFKRSVDDAKKTLEQYKNAENEATRALRQHNDVQQSSINAYQRTLTELSKVASGSMNTTRAQKALADQVKELKIQYANLSTTAQQSDFGKAIQASAAKAQQQLEQMKSQMDAVNTKTKNLSSTTKESSNSFNDIVSVVGKYAIALGTADKALGVVKDAFMSTETNIDAWGTVVSQAESTYKVFLNTLNTGNWSNFFSNLTTAINGAAELYNKLDRLGSIKTNNQAAIAIVEQTIANLRLRKQQGENVDEELKAAQERLTYLRKQEINAGQDAGKESMRQALKEHGFNGDARELDMVVNFITSRGQDAFDFYDGKLAELKKKIKTVNVTTVQGQGYSSTTQKEDFSDFTAEEKRQYNMLKAIHDSETSMVEGIGIYANAISQATGLTRELTKSNNILSKQTGNGSPAPTTKTPTTVRPKINLELTGGRTEAQIKAQIKELQTKIENTPDNVLRIKLIADKTSLENELKNFGKHDTTGIKQAAAKMDLSGVKNANLKVSNEQNESLDEQLHIVNSLVSSYAALGSAIANASNSGNFSTIIAQLIQMIPQIMTAVSAFAALTVAEGASKTNAWEEALVAAASLAATMISTISAVKAGTKKYANGGIVGGSTTVGDYNIVRANKGEMILNGTQQAQLFRMLNMGGTVNNNNDISNVHFRIQGSDLVGVLDSYNRRNKKVL